MEMLSFTIGGVLGPVIAGALIAWVGAPNVVIVDAASYFAFALALAWLATRPAPRPSHEGVRVYHTGHAVQLLITHPVLAATTLMFMAFNIGGGLLAVWLPVLSDQALGGGPELYGGLLGVLAGGEVVSALVTGGRVFRRPLGLLICLAQALSGTALAIVLLGPAIVSTAAGLALFGAFSAPLTIWAQTLRMQVIPEQLRGRTFALLRTLMQSGNPIGGAAGGLLAPLLGLPALIGISALVIAIPGLLGTRVVALRTAGEYNGLPGEIQPAHET
jgi:hypothetical protein